MSENSSGNMSAPSAPETDLRSLAILCYVLFLLAGVSGITAIAGVIIAYVKKADARGTVWSSHFGNMIVVFWVMFAAVTISLVTFPISLGILIARDFTWPGLSLFTLPLFMWLLVLPILAIWYLYRVIRGLIRASDGRAY